jgi:hypothetical protein
MPSGHDRRPPRDLEDLPPTGEEARAQRRETLMPLVWIAIGLVAIITFIAIMQAYHGKGDSPARFAPNPVGVPGPPVKE